MESPPRRILIVANRTAATPTLLDEVSRRARAAPTSFSLLVPAAGSKDHADWTLELALPLLERAAGAPVHGIGAEGEGPLDAGPQDAASGAFDEIVISTLPRRVSRWLRRDLPSQVERLGLPVTVVTSAELQRNLAEGGSAPGAIR